MVKVSSTKREPTPQQGPEPEVYRREEGLVARLCAATDAVEHRLLRVALQGPAGLRAKVLPETSGVFYRGVSREELRSLEANEWHYDPRDPRDSFKFTTPRLATARAFCPPGGAVIQIESSHVLKYYQLSKTWNPPRWTKNAQEHVVLVDGTEKISVLEPGPARAFAPHQVTDRYPVQRQVRAGECVEIRLNPGRRGAPIEQIDLLWDGKYSQPSPDGARSAEGKPMYLDGVYAATSIVGADGAERVLEKENFVDEEEEDNLHDLGGWFGNYPRGEALRIRLSAKHPEGEGHPVELREVRVRYAYSGPRPPKIAVGQVVRAGESISIALPVADVARPVARVEVRWTDMLSGSWKDPGRAVGHLRFDGVPVGGRETVQSPETQSFDDLGGVVAKEGRFAIHIDDDDARIDWVKVYFADT